MPNWCEGKLKIRGKKEDILKFIKEGTQFVKYSIRENELIEPKIEIGDELEFKNIDFEKCINTLYIKGTTRHFLKPDTYNMIRETDIENEIIVVLDFKAAWGIDSGALRTISKRYNIDFKICAFERGMEFNQDIEITKGQIIKDDEIKFDDYVWECIDPTLGG